MTTLYLMGSLAGACALAFAGFLASRVRNADPGTEVMQEICEAINSGAMAFLKRQYRTLVIFVIVLAIIIVAAGALTSGENSMQPQTAIPFIIGAICSILAGNIGMRIATKANVRTANAARETGMNKALTIAFS
ncbi:MAG: sodium/proton-translocating pyrophosphatase, partial [Clostridia bacterium]|nr:sodium/proton-translocating pyrophosphatase [Clostridia bacterium]